MTKEDKDTYLFKLKFSDFLFKKYGKTALRDIEEYEIDRMAEIWNRIGEQTNRTPQELVDRLWKAMGSDFEYSIVTNTDDEIEIKCVKCPFNDLAKETGLKEVIFSTFCMSDYGIVKGFNPNIEFSRTKTLVQGCDCCNHKYAIK